MQVCGRMQGVLVWPNHRARRGQGGQKDKPNYQALGIWGVMCLEASSFVWALV